MRQSYDYLVFIGRFEPFHLGHHFVITKALERAKSVILLIGSANAPRTLKNPFNFQERVAMIQGAFESKDCQRLQCCPIDDTLYNDQQWIKNVQSAVYGIAPPTANIGIIGHDKDDSSYYLSLFPMWSCELLPNFEQLSATPIRDAYFSEQADFEQFLPKSSQVFLQNFKKSDEFTKLQNEYRHVQAYQQAWQNAPYPPIFVTTDALVVQAGHILLIERGGEYGRGLWALAGGFLDKDETLIQCVVRELQEEVGLDLSHLTPKSSHVFDRPDRSMRGRTITHLFYFELLGDELPVLSAGDDASRAFWLPLYELDSKRFFEDHYSMIASVLGL